MERYYYDTYETAYEDMLRCINRIAESKCEKTDTVHS